MNTKELRIGNLVLISGRIEKIYRIERDGVNGWVEQGVRIKEVFKPIPLTEEWLLKFGFEKVKDTFITFDSYHYENENCWIYLIDKGFEFELKTGDERHNLCRTYQYVHQLQNLYFALTGQELTINI